MLEQDVRDIPDLRFDIELLVTEPPVVASRLRFNCSPSGTFLGLHVDGKRDRFHGKRVLRVPRREDRAGMVGDRQKRDRSANIICSTLRRAMWSAVKTDTR
jgi:predicted ester cyclase